MSSQPWMISGSKRSEGARRNLAKRKGLTEAGRQRLRESARLHQPWKHSTGPKTEQGRLQSVRNGKVRQKGDVSVREAREEVKQHQQLLQFLLAHPELVFSE